MAPLIAHVPTLRHALHETKQFQALAFEGAYLHLSEFYGTACARWEFPRAHDSTDRCLAEFLTAGLLRMLRGFGCMRDQLYAVRFEYRRPSCDAEYAKVFEGTERFSQDFTGLEFAASLLDRPHLLSNPGLQDMVHALAEQRLVRLSRTKSLVDRLRMYLLNLPAARVPDMRVAARDLRVSVRSLRRRLAEEGVSYRELTNELQRERACAMMRNPEFTLKAVADALGFADMAGFYRAFKRWTGVTAKGYRRSH
jgi:AraC-like DNA-binding protein